MSYDLSPSQPTSAIRPTLVFDGDCSFCRYWVDYWRALTGAQIDYQPYQEVASRYSTFNAQDFAKAIVFFETDGSVARGAEAAMRVLERVPGRGFWPWCYHHVPGYAGLAEAAYRVIARHRVAAARMSRVLWGPQLVPAQHTLVSSLFLRLLGFIYLTAFLSFGSQCAGLIGPNGILPLPSFLFAVQDYLGLRAYYEVPTLFWIADSDIAVKMVCAIGALLGGLLACGLQSRVLLGLLFIGYLSLFYAGQDFMHFQWDLLLLEVGFVAILLPGSTTFVIWLLRWITFRFLFLAGFVKLQSLDPTWSGLTALEYHFFTQPLPTVLAWFANSLSPTILKIGTAATLVVELVLPFFIFLPRRPRMVAAVVVFAFQGLITLTGNYNFFNLLTMALCLTLLDDAALRAVLPRWACASVSNVIPRFSVATAAFGSLILTLGAIQLTEQVTRRLAWAPLHGLYQLSAPFRIANSYGLFANMTTSRAEIVIEGSADARAWQPYEFRYKPSDPLRRPGWNIPHQPRLDWQMWFAALSTASDQPWFGNLLVRLLQGSPEVLALFANNPFPLNPPSYVRARVFDYRFTSPVERVQSLAWWVRREQGLYMPAIRLQVR
ncbi:MAG: DUF393 domain-containing protein [Gammaproteobacteria bacterium]|nr:DUF393 domain-containing protein [Gammaproteobacteria bacterium]